VSHVAYFWSYSFVRLGVYILAAGVVGILLFLMVSSVVTRQRLGKRGGLAIGEINRLAGMVKEKGGDI